MSSRTLRFLTYLAPSLPVEIFELVADHVGRTLGVSTSVSTDTARSGPTPGASDPFSLGHADVGFLCAPSLLELLRRSPPPVRFVAAAPVFAEPRTQGRPVYFSDVIVAREAPFQRLADLRDRIWVYNDTCSLSGYWSVLDRLARAGEAPRFFAALEASGSHLESIRRVAEGRADAAAIDSNVLCRVLRENPPLEVRLRVLESWGPHPVQPIVIRSGLAAALEARLTEALLSMADAPATGKALRALGVERFARSRLEDYERQAAVLERVGALVGPLESA